MSTVVMLFNGEVLPYDVDFTPEQVEVCFESGVMWMDDEGLHHLVQPVDVYLVILEGGPDAPQREPEPEENSDGALP